MKEDREGIAQRLNAAGEQPKDQRTKSRSYRAALFVFSFFVAPLWQTMMVSALGTIQLRKCSMRS
jgi:hypothetical protein